jgi:hypothetical protein
VWGAKTAISMSTTPNKWSCWSWRGRVKEPEIPDVTAKKAAAWKTTVSATVVDGRVRPPATVPRVKIANSSHANGRDIWKYQTGICRHSEKRTYFFDDHYFFMKTYIHQSSLC